jgi:hypothetical protein
MGPSRLKGLFIKETNHKITESLQVSADNNEIVRR